MEGGGARVHRDRMLNAQICGDVVFERLDERPCGEGAALDQRLQIGAHVVCNFFPLNCKIVKWDSLTRSRESQVGEIDVHFLLRQRCCEFASCAGLKESRCAAGCKIGKVWVTIAPAPTNPPISVLERNGLRWNDQPA